MAKKDNISLMNLPTEIHHEIFTFLDYIRDICCNPILCQPEISMPSTLEEFEEDFCSEDLLDFDQPASKVPFFLACKSLLRSVKSFKPTMLKLTVFSDVRRCRYGVDEYYMQLLTVFPWIYKQHRCGKNNQDWLDEFLQLYKKMKHLCQSDPLRKVEFISFSYKLGKNHTSNPFINFSVLAQILTKLPSTKYVLLNFNQRSLTDSESVIIMQPVVMSCRSVFTQTNNIYSTAFEQQQRPPLDSMEKLKNIFPKNYPRNIEIILYNSIISRNIKDAKYIVDNFDLDITLFSYIWNVQSNYLIQMDLNFFKEILDTLQLVYKKYPKFRVFRIPIDSLECLDIAKSYPFIQISPSKNISRAFLNSISQDDIPQISSYGISLSQLGALKFSASCFIHDLQFENSNSCDVNGVAPSMITFQHSDFNARDKFGNNILHYYFFKSSEVIDFLKQIPEATLERLFSESNIFDVTPAYLALLTQQRIGKFTNFSKKKLNYDEGRDKFLGPTFPKLLILEGAIVDARILLAFGNRVDDNCDYEEYKDINYRDENGKHLVHYSNNMFNKNLASHLNISMKEIIYCKDNNGTMPIQTSCINYHIALNHLGSFENMPKVNFVSHQDEFGMLRILYLLVDNYLSTDKLVCESFSIGFDYSAGQPELLSLSSYYSKGLYHFSIDRSIMKPLRGIKHFGTVDGDDISHFVLRCYFNFIKSKETYYVDNSILKALIAKGLRFDIVPNSKGQTAFDLFDEFTGSSNAMREVAKLKKLCRKGLTKSKALSKFRIHHATIPPELIVEKSETTLVLKTRTVSPFCIRIKRSLYFEKKALLNL